MVRGPDGVPYVIDRVDEVGLPHRPQDRRPRPSWSRPARRTRAARSPRRATSAVGGQDLLILDSKNVLWRWRPADDTGKGTLTKVTLEGAASLGDDIMGINTFLRPGTRGLYNLYIVDPSEQQIRAYSPAADGSGFPAKPTAWLATARDVSRMTSTYVDGDLFVADGGAHACASSAARTRAGTPRTRRTRSCGRRRPTRSSPSGRRGARARSTATTSRTRGSSRSSKVDGAFRAQYRLAGGVKDLSDLRGDVRHRRAQRASRRRSSGYRATPSTRRSSWRSPTRPPAEPRRFRDPERQPAEGDPEADQEALTGRPA